jgi:hypothetical protein
MGPSTANLDMKPSMGTDHHKSLLLNHLRPEGAILGVHDFHRRMPGLTVEQIKEALRQLVTERMVLVRFESTAEGKKFYVPPK